MENLRFIVIAGICLLLPFDDAHAYHVSVHKDLTKQTLEQYNNFKDSLTMGDIAAAVQGSIDEDTGSRPANHFYDYVTGQSIAPTNLSAALWATDTIAQANAGWNQLAASEALFSDATDYSWDRAVYEYVHGDRVRAMETLGHLLHLVQDATSPAHVRSDDHLSYWGFGDPDLYEEFTKNLAVPAHTVQGVKHFDDFVSLYTELAHFTGNNFMSKDTIFTRSTPQRQGLKLRKAEIDGVNKYFGIGSVGELVLITQEKDWKAGGYNEIYTLGDKGNKVLTNYYNQLTPKAIDYGVAMVDLFFRDVAEERQTNNLAYMNKSYNEVKSIATAMGGFNTVKGLFGSSLSAADAYELNKDEWEGARKAAALYNIPFPDAPSGSSPLASVAPTAQLASVVQAITPEPVPAPVADTPVVPTAPPPTPAPQVQVSPGSEQQPPQPVPTTVTEPTPILAPPAPAAPSPQSVPAPSTPAPSVFGPGSVNLSFGSGMGVGGGTATGGGGGGGSAPAPTPEPVVTAEATSTATTTTESASSTATTTAATSTEEVADTATTTATTTEPVIEFGNVVINEVAWLGTENHPEDEWFELYNNESHSVSLEGWRLESARDGFSVSLSGSIAPGEYFLVEPDEAVTSEPASLVTPFTGAMPYVATSLYLIAGTTTIDTLTPKDGHWRGGYSNTTGPRNTLERFIPAGPSDADDNWFSSSLYIHNGTNRDGVPLRGTPGARNSTNYQLTYNSSIRGDVTIDASRSPYKVQSVGVPTGSTLTITDGAEVIFLSEPHEALSVLGTLIVDNATFTTDSATSGGWKGIRVINNGQVELTNTTIEYAETGIRNERINYANMTPDEDGNGTIHITHSTIDKSKTHGVLLSGSTLVMQGSTVSNSGKSGIVHEYSADVTVTSSTFTNNAEMAVLHQSYKPGLYENNMGSGNGINGIYMGASDRSLVPNGTTVWSYNQLPYVIQGVAIGSGKTLVLEPGVMVKATVQGSIWGRGKILIQDGGTLSLQGTESEPVVLTSLNDPDNNPQAGDWWGVIVGSGGVVTGASTSTAEIRYTDAATPVPW